MATVHLTTDSEPGLRGEPKGRRDPASCELPKGGASNAESSSTLAAILTALALASLGAMDWGP